MHRCFYVYLLNYYILKYFLRRWETAQILLLQKPEKDSHQATSYRLISLLPTICKILEKIQKRNLATNLASETNTLKLNKCTVLAGRENKMYCIAVFLDIEKNFL